MATTIGAHQVKELREATGAGMMECKRALEEAEGVMDKAVEILRKRGIARAANKASRIANEGIVTAYVHNSGTGARLGVLVELNCESDFVAKTEDFHELARELALQVAGRAPLYVRRENVPADVVAHEKEIYRAQVQGKPENIVEKIVEGKLEAFYGEVCLLDQTWVKDERGKKKVDELIKESIARMGENITVARFARFVVGETAPTATAGDGAGGAGQ